MDRRLGLIGAGRWGRRYIATIESLPGVRLTHLCTTRPENRALVGPDVLVTADWQAMCRAGGMDGVIIATPPALHGPMLLACLDAGLPAMVEKPLCLSVAEADEIRRRVEATGVPVLVDHTYLFHPAVEELRRRVAPEAVRFIHLESAAFGPFRKGQAPVLWDRGPHAVALCLALRGAAPGRASALGAFPVTGPLDETHVLAIRLDFESGARAWIQIGHLSPRKRTRAAVFAEDRLLVFDDLASQPLVEHPHQWNPDPGALAELVPGTAIAVPDELPLTRAVRRFAEGLAGRPSPCFGVGLAVHVVRVLAAADASLAGGGAPVGFAP